MLTMDKQTTIKTLCAQKVRPCDIARQVDCHRNTVRNIRLRPKVLEKQTRDRASYFDQFKVEIEGYLNRPKPLTNLRIYELLGGKASLAHTYDSLCKYIQKEFVAMRLPVAFGVQTTSPGEVTEVDFGYAGLQPINHQGDSLIRARTWFLSVRFNYSRIAYREITHDQTVATFIQGITHAFEFFGGVPKQLKVDNLKAAVIHNQHYDLTLNQDFLAFALHYHCVINPCEPYHPEQKGGVESDVKYIENNFLAGRQFTSIEDLTSQFAHWSTHYANARIHGTTKQIPTEVFLLEEQSALQPLPLTPFPVFNRYERKVQMNCHVCFRINYYSVPARLVSKTVTLKLEGQLLRISYQGEEVACHQLCTLLGQYVTVRSHLPENKYYGQAEYQAKLRAQMATMGDLAVNYFDQVLVHDPYYHQKVRNMLGLAQKHGNEVVNLSLGRALKFKLTDSVMIKHIVEQQLYRLDTAPKLLAGSPPASTFLTQVLSGLQTKFGQMLTGQPPPDLCRDTSYYQHLIEKGTI